MRKVDVVFLWHMHQPDYRDPVSEIPLLPWVRLHATRAYLDMADALERHPAVKAAVNFVPVLIDQLEALVAGTTDLYLTLSYKPARLLTEDDATFLLRQFFSCHAETGIRARPRYEALWRKRGSADAPRSARDFDERDLRDLQVLFNLTWFGATARREYPLIAQLEAKGAGFTEDEKRRLLRVQVACARRVLPAWRRLIARGQVEASTTPYFHPILPLLIDSDIAAEGLPGAPLPPRFAWPADARTQVTRAVERHTQVFGQAPVGVWPAEGSVSPDAVRLFNDAGLRWMATDEAQLFHTLPSGVDRADALYRARHVDVNGAQIDAFFRDRTLSDLLGFSYAHNAPEVSARDLMARLHEIGTQWRGEGTPVVVIALDGENPWEAYAQSGAPFLDALYALLAADEAVRTRTPTEVLNSSARAPLHGLASGSWIDGNFGVWIGKPVENSAWRLLGEVRSLLASAEASGVASPESVAHAREHLLRAEGSDWFWWYGDRFVSDNDAEFDYLFRGHLRAACVALGVPCPPALGRSLYPTSTASPDRGRTPRAFVSPNFAKETTFFDWADAGVLDLSVQGSMHRTGAVFRRLRWGFDAGSLYLRLEPSDGETVDTSTLMLRVDISRDDATAAQHHFVEVHLAAPESACVTRADARGHSVRLTGTPQVKVRPSGVEVGVTFGALEVEAGAQLVVSVALLRDGLELERHPAGRPLTFEVPALTYEDENWSV